MTDSNYRTAIDDVQDLLIELLDDPEHGIETLKNNETFNLRNPDGTVLTVHDSRDLFLPLGTVIAGNDEHVYSLTDR